MLPDMEGFEVAERLGAQRASLPIIFLTARDATQDKIRGLTSGGDDYVTKPFSLEELVARIRVILRRTGAASPSSSRLTFEDLELDEDTREVTRAGAADRADRHRVPPAALPAAQPAPRAHARAAARPRLGVRLRRRLADPRDVRQLPAQEARPARPVAHPDRARRRLRAAPAAEAERAMSLRARLVIGLVTLAAVGLLVLGAVTYGALSSFEVNRVDDQASAAIGPAVQALERRASSRARTPTAVRELPGDVPGSPAPARPGDRRAAAAAPAAPAGPEGRPGGDRPDPPPSGTYAEQRDAAGRGGRGHVPRPDARRDGARRADPADGHPARRAPRRSSSGGQALPRLRRGHAAARRPDDDRRDPVHRGRRDARPAAAHRGARDRGGPGGARASPRGGSSRLGLRPLDRIGETAGAIAGGDLSRRVEPAEPRTEVGRLGLALNAMLARLEEAFAERRASEERLRRFLADASHELRTPLASIRGYAELFRIGAAREGPDVEKAMSRIEDESARMGVLVEDLLALARLDEVRDQHREPVDLDAARRRRRRRRARRRAGPRDRARHGAATATSSLDGDPASCARCSRTSCATRSCTRPPARRSRCRWTRWRTPRGAPGGPRPRAGAARRRPGRAVRALLARRPGPRARARGRRARAVDRRGDRRRARRPRGGRRRRRLAARASR